MADITPLIRSGTQIVQSYANGGFRVSGKTYEGGVLVEPLRTRPWPEAGLDLSAFQPIFLLPEPPELVLIGCGARGQTLSESVRAEFRSRGILVETMDTGAACRTYNVLIAEGRRVMGALMPVS